MLKIFQNLFFGVIIFLATAPSAKAENANWPDEAESLATKAETASESQLLDELMAKYNYAQTNGGTAGSVARSLNYLDDLRALTKKGVLPEPLESNFVANEENIREKLGEIASDIPDAAADPQSGILKNQDDTLISLQNWFIIPIWMRSAELHFQKAASNQSNFEFFLGMQVLDTILFQQSTRQAFVYNVAPAHTKTEEMEVAEVCYKPTDDQQENESFLSKFNRHLNQAQGALDAVSPLTPVFDWIHEGVTGEERTSDFSQDYWDVRNLVQDKVHAALDVGGMVPVIGEPVDVYNGVLYSSQGDKLNAALSFGATIPFLGMGSTAAKYTDNVAHLITNNKTVLGKFPDYVNMAKQLNANYFQVPPEVWKKMTTAEQWLANQKFLDRLILRGDEIILSNPVKNLDEVTGAFRNEIDYLMKQGFQLSEDGTKLIKP